MSLKTFIIVNMKENVYDSLHYKRNWEDQSKLGHNGGLYEPLKDLSDLLYYAILASILSAVFQITIGLHLHWLSSVFCIWSVIFAVLLLLDSLVLIKRNLNTWFSFLEDTTI